MNNNAISSIHSDLSLDTKEEKLTVHILNVAQRKNIESDIPVGYILKLSIPQLLHQLDIVFRNWKQSEESVKGRYLILLQVTKVV